MSQEQMPTKDEYLLLQQVATQSRNSAISQDQLSTSPPIRNLRQSQKRMRQKD